MNTVRNEIKGLVEEYNIEDIQFDTEFSSFHEREKKMAEEIGAEDGARKIPKVDATTLSASEMEIKESYQSKVEQNSEIAQPYLEKLRQNYIVKYKEEIRNSKVTERESDLKDLENWKHDRMEELQTVREEKIEDLKGKRSFTQAKNDYEHALPEYESISNREGRRETNASLSDGIYWMIFVFIALLEAGVNYVVFELFGESKALTYVFAIGVGVLLAFLAHFYGGSLKQKGFANPAGLFTLLGLAALIIVMAVVVSDLRGYFVVEQGVLPENLVSSTTILFAVLTILFFSLGTIASYYHHDSNPQFLKIKNRVERLKDKYNEQQDLLEHRIEQIKEEYREKQKEINKKFSERYKRIKDEKDILSGLIQEVVGHYNAILHESQAMEKKIQASFMETISNYRSANQRVRPTENAPEIWSDGVTLEYSMNEQEALSIEDTI